MLRKAGLEEAQLLKSLANCCGERIGTSIADNQAESSGTAAVTGGSKPKTMRVVSV